MMLSFLDTDFYTFTVGQIAWSQFPKKFVRYRMFNRRGVIFPPGFAKRLQKLLMIRVPALTLTDEQATWLQAHGVDQAYVDWLKTYRFDLGEVLIQQDSANGNLDIEISGPWARCIYWEVPLLAACSELFFECQGASPEFGWVDRIGQKRDQMARYGCRWGETGTRRRFSTLVQQRVVEQMMKSRNFLGTSNAHFAYVYDIQPLGTMSHQGPMAMQSELSVLEATSEWLGRWLEEFGQGGIILPDTLTSKHFFENEFTRHFGEKFDGFRHDSGEPVAFVDLAEAACARVGLDLRDKTVVFSDRMTADRLVKLQEQFSDRCRVVGNLGTHLTNDVGHKPLDLVIKLVEADDQYVIKISDEPEKATGNKDAIDWARREIKSLAAVSHEA